MITVLRDIRYFEATGHLLTALPSYAGSIYKFPKPAISIGQRIGCKCEELDISIGGQSHLYIAFVPDLKTGEVVLSNYQAAPWYRFVACGLSSEFNEMPFNAKMQQVEEVTWKSLRACSAQDAAIQEAESQLRQFGESLCLVRKEKDLKRFNIKVMFTVAPSGTSSLMWLRVTEKATNLVRDTKPQPLRFYVDIYDVADSISMKDSEIIVKPKTSFRAGLTTQNYECPIRVNMAALVADQLGVPAKDVVSCSSPLWKARVAHKGGL